MSRIFSGIQPTGSLHLGNYLGAIKNWCNIQHSMQALFCIVDMHALTVPTLVHYKNIHNTLATYLACGIDLQKAIIFVQSSVPEHTYLSWIFSCLTPLSRLNLMTQFKEKSTKTRACLGLYAYPVLMAADILLYKATHVPVGEDQTQHLELARDIAQLFNSYYERDYFLLPEIMVMQNTARIMSLRNPQKKMSKSDASDMSRINLSDDENAIKHKISKATTDDIKGFDMETLPQRPAAHNLLNIYAAMCNKTLAQVCEEMYTANFVTLKKNLIEVLIEELTSLRKKIEDLKQDTNYLDSVLQKGAAQAREIAINNIREICQIVQLYGYENL